MKYYDVPTYYAMLCAQVIFYPASNPHAEKGLMTLERFLGCTGA